MPRLARIVIPGFPHHVVQRGNRRQPTFFQPDDYRNYLALISHWCHRHDVTIWAYCLMTNHVHLILVPSAKDGLRRAISETHRRYSRKINFRNDWRGYLFQGRFSSYPLDTKLLLQAARYIERNPVEAGLVTEPEEYPWSSAHAHVTGSKDPYLDPSPLLDVMEDWKTYLLNPLSSHEVSRLELHERTGRPLGDHAFITRLEREVGRHLLPGRPGRKRKVVEPEMRMVSPD
jgi:putative transposase